ncbi:hypothetical protein ACHAPJ_000726 [Fusarium lateritium]
MQGSASFPAALGSSKWIASFLMKHRDDEDTTHQASPIDEGSNPEAKYLHLYKKTKTELRSIFSSNTKKSSWSELKEAELFTQNNGTIAQNKDVKSTWAMIFDTKSGNKLHKRAKSAPVAVNNHVAHNLEPIDEVLEEHEVPMLGLVMKPTSVMVLPRKSSREMSQGSKALKGSAGHGNDHDDNKSVSDAGTAITEWPGLEDVTEQDEEAASETGTVIVKKPPVLADLAEEDEESITSKRTSTTNSEDKTTPLSKPEQTNETENVSTQETPAPALETPRAIRIECSGALVTDETPGITENIDHEEHQTRDTTTKEEEKPSGSLSYTKSLMKKAFEMAKQPFKSHGSVVEQPVRLLRRKGRLQPDWTNKDKTDVSLGSLNSRSQKSSEASDSSKASRSSKLSRFFKVSHRAHKRGKSHSTVGSKTTVSHYEPLVLCLPPQDGGFGHVIREFSGDLKEPKAKVSEDSPIAKSPGKSINATEVAEPPEFDESMGEITPTGAKRQALDLESDSRDISMQGLDEALTYKKTRSPNKAVCHETPKKESTAPQQEGDSAYQGLSPCNFRPWNGGSCQRGAPFAADQEMQKAFEDHQAALARERQRKLQGVAEADDQSEPEEPIEQRQLRELGEDLEQNDVDSQAAISPVEPLAEDNIYDDSRAGDFANESQGLVFRDDDVLAEDSQVKKSQGVEPQDEEEQAKALIVDALKAQEKRAAETKSKAGLTGEDKSVEAYGPNRFWDNTGSGAVREWFQKLVENTDNGNMVRDEAAEKFYDGQESLCSDFTTPPSENEVREALNHKDAPQIHDCPPQQVFRQMEVFTRSIERNVLVREAFATGVQSIKKINEMIYENYDLATDAVLASEIKEADLKADHRRKKIYKAVTRKYRIAQARARTVLRDSNGLHAYIKALEQERQEMTEEIHRSVERLGCRRATNLTDAMDIIYRTIREERLDLSIVQPQEEEPDVSSPESVLAMMDETGYQNLVNDDSQDEEPEPENPEDMFF